ICRRTDTRNPHTDNNDGSAQNRRVPHSLRWLQRLRVFSRAISSRIRVGASSHVQPVEGLIHAQPTHGQHDGSAQNRRVPHSLRWLQRVRILSEMIFYDCLPLRIGRTQSCHTMPVKTIAAPHPVFGCLRQSSVHRIEVYIVQFLIPFLCAPHIEVVKPPLPEVRVTFQIVSSPKLHLPFYPRSSLFAQRSRHALLQRFHHVRRIPYIRFADQ